MTVAELAQRLNRHFKGKRFPPCNRRNGKPADGWSIVGHSGITRAIMQAGLPYNAYWSGSNPTPSTQAPSVIVAYARSIM